MTKPDGRRVRLADLLVERGFYSTLEQASAHILAGHVRVDGGLVDKAGTAVSTTARLVVRAGTRFASRGGFKLATALQTFSIQVSGRVAIDCGAAAGGFTDCLLQQGASFVHAVDAGVGQLVGRLAADSRVRNWERTNLGELHRVQFEPPPDLITLDLSYLSLRDALPLASRLLDAEGDVLALFKPLFEVEDASARRTGRINGDHLIVESLQRALDVGARAGLQPLRGIKLALRPRHGVHEYFLWFQRATLAAQWTPSYDELADLVGGKGIGPDEAW
ncbi:MAG: TlyA family RNA methyltransferase [Chloroflexi bacterium]|nr:TlyA family RNA methyltransferase [Chloroflexota bacterium]